MKKKSVYLFLALLLPILIFFFLKFFGRSEFDIPIQYESGVPDSLRCTTYNGQGQYFLPDSLFGEKKLQLANLFVGDEIKEVTRLKEDVGDKNWQVIFLRDMPHAETIKDCVLFLKKPWTAVLVDNQKRIRGYYALAHRDDLDRLKIELTILMKKY
ncbi:MAG: hypothetical protein JSS93_07675 [Bacteroidetes bacterium]|nr:hypothetical protein [Bacteroidota bacterium]